MHIDFVVEGIQDQLDEFEKWWSTRTLPMVCTSKKGVKTTAYVQAALRARRAYTLVFPKENLDLVLNTLKPADKVALVDGKATRILKKPMAIVRKLLHLKPIPKSDPKAGIMPMRKFEGMRVVGLGIREDMDITEKDGGTHEGL